MSRHPEVGAPECFRNGGPDRNRTCDTRFRKPLLYPTELRALRGRELILACGIDRMAR